MDAIFESCPTCSVEWGTLRGFVDDPHVRIAGMQANMNFPKELCHFYFVHGALGCGSTFAVRIEKFQDLIGEPIPDTILAGEDGCDRKCLDLHNLLLCHKPCRNAPFRRLAAKLGGLC